MRRALTLAVTAVALAAAPADAQTAPAWRLEQPAPPAGAPYKVPLGVPGDLSFWAPNRGLLSVEGNDTVPRGLLYYDGTGWRTLATVCGGTGDSSRIVWAGPTEFWTITFPSRPRSGAGRSLCRFKDGQVVGSYSTADSAIDPYRQMTAGACLAADNCWFGGVVATDATGSRVGNFHLHWDGTELRSVYAPQGHGVSDMTTAFGGFFESTVVGAVPGTNAPPLLATPDDGPQNLVQNLLGDNWVVDPFQMPSRPNVPEDGTELLAVDSGGDDVWVVGGGAASGPSKPAQGGAVATAPYAAMRTSTAPFAEVGFDPSLFKTTERFVDVSAVGGGVAYAAVQQPIDSRSTNARSRVARLSADGSVSVTTLPTSGAGRGSAAKIAFTSPTEGWMVTSAGWLFHYTDGTPLPQDTDPAFQTLIDFRPNEAAEQFVPDDPPEDDSLINQPIQVNPKPDKTKKPKRVRLKAFLKHARTKLIKRNLTLVVTFKLTRRGKVAVLAKKSGRVVARTALRKLGPGKHALRLKLSRKRYPDALKFVTRDPKANGTENPDDDTIVTTR